MKKRGLLGVLSTIDTAFAAGGKPSAGQPSDEPVDKGQRDDGVAKATQAYLLYVALPIWTIPGFGDWICHRRTKIEHTSGTHESLTHALMMTAVGIPALMALLLEVNASTILALFGGFVVHEGIVIWDVAYAAGRRKVTPTEQHFHSFLEVLPFMSLSFVLCLHWDQVVALLGKGPSRPSFAIRPKESPIHPAYLVGIGAVITSLIAVPYAEELIRCFRVDRSLAPHKRPSAQALHADPSAPSAM
jgi:hypothetical protein